MLTRIFLVLGGMLAALTAVLWGAGRTALLGWGVIPMIACLAISARTTRRFRGFVFTLWVLTFVAAAMFYPSAFRSWGTFELKALMIPLIQLIMFGMGTTLSVQDFTRVLAMPRAILIGMGLQFTVMPLAGAGIAAAFGFDPTVAAGVVLIGSCPGGVASNVMTYIAKGNVALSVSMTACSTLASPLMTPLMMRLLAGQYIEIDFVAMMWTIIKIIIVPIVAGLIANRVLQMLKWRGPWLDRALSIMAMAAICFIIAIITSLSRDKLLSVGLLLIGAAILHNTVGYVLGYTGAWMAGLDETARRTVAIEVGLQNGGMASGLAVTVLNSPDTALAPAIFGPWMNMSGSMLASWWRERPVASSVASAAAARPTGAAG